MKKSERKFKINQFVDKKGKVSIQELSLTFDVTEETIRRDLKELENEKLINKIHGGAVSLKYNVETPLEQRFYLNSKRKEFIAKKAIKHIPPFSRIFIDFGSTTLAFAEELSDVDNLEIFTNSPLLAKTAYKANHTHNIYILGGHYLPEEHQNTGFMTLNSINNLLLDFSITSAVAIDPVHGLFNTSQHETEIAKSMMFNARKCMVLIDNSKLDNKRVWKVCSFNQIDILVSDEPNEIIKSICDNNGVAYY